MNSCWRNVRGLVLAFGTASMKSMISYASLREALKWSEPRDGARTSTAGSRGVQRRQRVMQAAAMSTVSKVMQVGSQAAFVALASAGRCCVNAPMLQMPDARAPTNPNDSAGWGRRVGQALPLNAAYFARLSRTSN